MTTNNLLNNKINSLSKDLALTKAAAILAVKQNGLRIKKLDTWLKFDPDVIFAAVTQNGKAIFVHTPELIQSLPDREIILLRASYNLLDRDLRRLSVYLPEALKENADFLATMIDANPNFDTDRSIAVSLFMSKPMYDEIHKELSYYPEHAEWHALKQALLIAGPRLAAIKLHNAFRSAAKPYRNSRLSSKLRV